MLTAQPSACEVVAFSRIQPPNVSAGRVRTRPRMRDARVSTEKAVRAERWLPGPIELIWAWITEADLLRTWLPEITVVPRLGGKLHLTRAPGAHTPEDASCVDGVVTRCDPPHFLTYAWIEHDRRRGRSDLSVASELAFELHERGDEVGLVLTQRRVLITEIPQLHAAHARKKR